MNDPLSTFIIGLVAGVTLAVIVHFHFVRPVFSEKESRQAAREVQGRCEDEFATFPRQRGKKLIEGIEKCRLVAGFKGVGGNQ